MDVRFVILAKPGSPNRDKFRRLPVVVGRADDAAIRLPADYVSRRHCEVFERDGAVFVRDLGSTNGTSIDGERLTGDIEVPVRSGGLIQIGGYRIRIEFGTSGTTAVAMPAATAAGADDGKTVPLPDAGTMAAPPPPQAGDFAFLAPDSDDAAPDGEAEWPTPAAEAPDDGDLDTFFKSLS